jgi:hypothetical protein
VTKPSLAHDASPEAYGDAMILCQGYAPSCSDAGECAHDGRCFSGSGRGFGAARKRIAKMIEDESDVFVRSWLKTALDALDQHQFMERGALDAMRYLQINKRVRALYNCPTERGY